MEVKIHFFRAEQRVSGVDYRILREIIGRGAVPHVEIEDGKRAVVQPAGRGGLDINQGFVVGERGYIASGKI